MTAATATPLVMRDRLLQAIDGQGNVCNMVVVMEVVSYLEKYPITKEALEETRLGKHINDVRKQTKNKDLAKRAKNLLRNWQKLIEPRKSEVLSKGHSGTSWSSNGGLQPHIPAKGGATRSRQTALELKNRNDFNNCFSPMVEKSSNRKRKGGPMDGQLLPTKVSKLTPNDKTHNSKQLPTNGLDPEGHAHQPLEKEISELLDNDRLSKIPVNAVKPHPSSSPGYSKPPSTSLLLKTSVLQQQARLEQAASGGLQQAKSPQCSSRSPRASKQEAVVKQAAPRAQSVSGLTGSPASVESSGSGPSPVSLNVCVQGLHTEGPLSADCRLSKSPNDVSPEDANAFRCRGRKKKLQHKSKNPVVNVKGQTKKGTKCVRLKDRRLTFDPVTGQIKPSAHKEGEEDNSSPQHNTQCSEVLQKNQQVGPSPFQQTDWKELSRSEIVQSYLSQQRSMLTLSATDASAAPIAITEEQPRSESKKVHMLRPDLPATDLPGISREVNKGDVDRLHTQHWPSVNGCFDNLGSWFKWSECISLDPRGDESRLHILPYVCLD
ncbi:mediator of RNA polymerase II transcription subunit 26-like isoform X2 [Genypterus blacodes]|uniref:mediator of RNA polymerase II transcription subunit 26-like isoform X2 n=1 Tax=Genypterus blacodes TaxID=154954 RepID=UPI003F777EB6